MDFRPRATGSSGSGWAGFQDGAAGTTRGENSSWMNENWATTTGYASATGRPPANDKTSAPVDAGGVYNASVASDVAEPSDASWVTDEPAEAPADGGPADDAAHAHQNPEQDEQQQAFRRRYKPRMCRICFEVVQPTFESVHGDDEDHEHDHDDAEAADAGAMGGEQAGLGAVVGDVAAGLRGRVAGAVASAIPTFLRSQQDRVRYVSEDPADGRLISPCRCKGSQKYVHEGCLQAWRHAQPLADRNFWTCPTCGFAYRVERLRWGRWVSNRATRALLTLVVFWLTLFVLGFVADPLLDLWLDPGGMLMDTFLELDEFADEGLLHNLQDALGDHGAHGAADGGGGGGDGLSGWLEHFVKGFFSLGIVGVVKTFFVVSPWTWWNLRGAGVGRARRRAGGQARVEGMGWVFVLVGAFTFLGAAWKGINYVSGRILERASEHIVDIGGEDDDGEEDNDDDDNEGADHENTNQPNTHNNE
ncbi:ring finger domain containing protein [Niveomyces insectorum RCEF 264]|uniref:Ring finger domain containing protein n=1 Tax=Niveomyces insectorum RCEF 264 TaxID=1081102 RepID=A0A167Z883_9HYPO|nr:ring finger domain containing protein [Niveomyces insectorum RCEF 264]